MSVEQFFGSREEEYEAAAWLSTLQIMQRLAERIEGKACAAAHLSGLVLKKPDEFLDTFRHYASQSSFIETVEKAFIVEIGAASRDGRIARGLSDAALLLCDDPVGQTIKETSSFRRLVPLVDEMTEYCDDKFLTSIQMDDLKDIPYSTRLRHARTETDFYIRQYDEPETAATLPLYL